MSPRQPCAQRGRLAAQAVHDLAGGIGPRLGHRQAALRQVLHQAQVERQLLARQSLEHRQHPVAGTGGDEVVGVLDAGADGDRLDQLARMQTLTNAATSWLANSVKTAMRESVPVGVQNENNCHSRWPLMPLDCDDWSRPASAGTIS